jgi:hypothetical protein
VAIPDEGTGVAADREPVKAPGKGQRPNAETRSPGVEIQAFKTKQRPMQIETGLYKLQDEGINIVVRHYGFYPISFQFNNC